MANYLKQGTNDNFIFDSAEIELAMFNNMRYSVMGYMLGDFDEHGVYAVDKEIVKELISMKKYISSSVDNVEICHSEIKLINPITFLVTFEEDCAILSLVEKISHEGNFKENGGSYSDINEYVLDRIETSGVINREIVYRRWNIGEFGGVALDINSLDEETKAQLFGIIGRFKYLLYVNTALLEREEELEEEEISYAEDMSKLLATFPKLKQAVDKSVKEKLTTKKDFIRIDKPFVARTMNEIVEQAIAENINVLKPKELENFKASKHEIVNQHNLRLASIIPVKVEKPAFNAENSVGVVKADTEVLNVSLLPKLPEIENAENADDLPVLHRNKEDRYSLIDLQKGLVLQHRNVEERLATAAVKFVTGQDIVADPEPIAVKSGKKVVYEMPQDAPKQTRNRRLQSLYGDFENKISKATEKKVEETKAGTNKTATEQPKSLIGKKVAPAVKAAAPKAAGKSAAPAKAGAPKKAGAAKAKTAAPAKASAPNTEAKGDKVAQEKKPAERRVNLGTRKVRPVKTTDETENKQQPVNKVEQPKKKPTTKQQPVVTVNELNANSKPQIDDVGGFDLRSLEQHKNATKAKAKLTEKNDKVNEKDLLKSNQNSNIKVRKLKRVIGELTEEELAEETLELAEENSNEIK